MEIFEQFGFDIKLFIAQIVNFLVIAYLFKRFLYKPILETLNKRSKAIAKGLKDAEMATKAFEEAEAQKEEILRKAGKEAEKILNEAKLQAQEARDHLMVDTKAEIDKMMENTKDQIALERENFKNEARNVSLEISKQILENTIGNLFDKKENDILIKKGLKSITSSKS